MSQQIYLPFGEKYPIPYEFEADTLPVPRGQFSILSELEKGHVTNAEAMVYLCLNHGSSWNSGATWSMSGPYLSKIFGKGMTRQYAQTTLAKLITKGWIIAVDKDSPSGYRYKLRHHLCDPEDVPVNEDGKPLTFSMPRGPGGVIERLKEGDISWRAALGWIVLKSRSNWKSYEETAGQTKAETLQSISKRCRMKLSGFHSIVNELTVVGMLERLSPKSQPAIFQLYPKPFPKPAAPKQSRIAYQWIWVGGLKIKADGEYWYSHNHQYRCNMETTTIEKQQRGGGWKPVSEYHKYQEMPQSILKDFDRAIEGQRVKNASSLDS